MKNKEIKDKDLPALKSELAEKQRKLLDLRTQAATEKLEDPTQVGKTKRDIARILTVIRQREIAAAVPAAV